jgi:PhzF family phenazine biosynthesis protein
MKIPLWQVDAFTDRVFAGNPAAVCALEAWLPDETLAAIAAENNLSETAFLVKEPAGSFTQDAKEPASSFTQGAKEPTSWRVRWFTPAAEVDLCGHATLASGHVVLARLDPAAAAVTFASRSGPLTVARTPEGLLAMTFPRRAAKRCPVPQGLARALGREPLETLAARDLLAVLGSEAEVRALAPDAAALAAMSELPGLGLIVTAPAATPGLDFVSRFFAPKVGVPEDPVTGSSHCTLIPYWAKRLGKARLEAAQLSRRGGRLSCEDQPEAETVRIAGRVAEYLEGSITL